MDLDGVRAFLAAVEHGRFQDAGDDLGITQQAVSKRLARLERDLGARLLVRGGHGARLTSDGEAFLRPARELVAAASRARAAVEAGGRPLRVDVVASRVAPAGLVGDFHRAYPDLALEVVTLPTADAAVAAVREGTLDAAVRAVVAPGRLPEGVVADRVLDEPVELVTGPGHPLAAVADVAVAELAGHAIVMPGLVPGSEWAAFYAELAAAFGLAVDASGPNLGTEILFDRIAAAADLATLVGARTRLDRPAGQDLVRTALRGPVPVYPHALVRRRDNPHPGLARLRDHLAGAGLPVGVAGTWTPAWT